MKLFRLTRDGLQACKVAAEMGNLTPGNLPIRIRRTDLASALSYFKGRGVNLDPNDLVWDITQRSPA